MCPSHSHHIPITTHTHTPPSGTPPPTPYDHLGNLQPTSVEYSPIAWDVEEVRGHVIVCGSEHSFVPFVEQLRASSPNALPVVVLHPSKPAQCWRQLSTMGPIFWVKVCVGCVCLVSVWCVFGFCVWLDLTQHTPHYLPPP